MSQLLQQRYLCFEYCLPLHSSNNDHTLHFDFYADHMNSMPQLDTSFTTHQLQGIISAQQTQSSCNLCARECSIIDSITRAATPYSPEEKKERIERYKIKRNLRNFNKRVKYECRKTLADSRPRVRGRFTRTVGTEKPTQGHWEYVACVKDDNEDDYNWNSFLDALSENLLPY